MHTKPDWKLPRIRDVGLAPDKSVELREAFDRLEKSAYERAYDLTSYETTNSGTPIKVLEEAFRKTLSEATPDAIEKLKARRRAKLKRDT